MNGWELAKRMKSLAKPPVIIAVTSYGQEEDRRRSEEAGIHLHLVKPVYPAFLAGMLKRIGMAVTSTECPSVIPGCALVRGS
jgi:CheY-like chemotaxis protein